MSEHDVSKAVESEDMKESVIREALKIVKGQRRNDYGTPEDNFGRISSLWNAYFENTGRGAAKITPADIAIMMLLMKVARLCETPNHRDSVVDGIGYLACYAEIILAKVLDERKETT